MSEVQIIKPHVLKASSMPEISHLRGLGEPNYFTFNIEPKSKILISHAVIFATFILPNDQEMHLATVDDDPRFPHFLHYLKRNILKDANDAIQEAVNLRDKLRAELADLERKIAAHQKQL